MLANDSSRAFYGPGHVRAAHELGAIGTLLITDTVLLVHDVGKVGLGIPNRARLHAALLTPDPFLCCFWDAVALVEASSLRRLGLD